MSFKGANCEQTPEKSSPPGGLPWVEHFKDLKVKTPLIQLRVGTPSELTQLGEVAEKFVVSPSQLGLKSNFRSEWDGLPPSKRNAFIVERQQMAWENFSLKKWNFPFIVFCEGEVIGEVFLRSQNFRENRIFSTVGWLGEPWRNKGLGLEVRSAAIHFGFGALSAERTLAHFFQESEQALNISKKLSYSLSGAVLCITQSRDIRRMLFYRLNRRLWEGRIKREDIEMEGMCLHFP